MCFGYVNRYIVLRVLYKYFFTINKSIALCAADYLSQTNLGLFPLWLFGAADSDVVSRHWETNNTWNAHTHTHAQRNSKKKGTNENPIFDWLYYVLLCLYLFSVFSSLYLYYYSRLIQKSVIKREESADFLTHITARHFNNTNRHFPTFCPVFSRNKTKRKKKTELYNK